MYHYNDRYRNRITLNTNYVALHKELFKLQCVLNMIDANKTFKIDLD